MQVSAPHGRIGLFRFLCTRRGAAVARGAMLVCALILPLAGTAITFVANEAWTELKKTKATIDDTSLKLDKFLAASEVRRDEWGRRLSNVEQANVIQQAQLDSQGNRLTRLEAERRR